MKCIIIDDEPIAHKIIEGYIENIDGLSIAKNFYNAVDALAFIHSSTVDLIFLDIHMPKLKGLDFVRTLDNPPAIIVTSAHSEYALESFELPIIEYLLKPFTFQRFLKAYTKFLKLKKNVVASKPSKQAKSSIFLKDDEGVHQVQFNTITHLESYGGYVKVFLEDDSYILVHQALYYFETNLSPDFIRVHRSFIVNKNKIKKIDGNRIYLKEKIVPVGRKYKDEINKLIG